MNITEMPTLSQADRNGDLTPRCSQATISKLLPTDRPDMKTVQERVDQGLPHQLKTTTSGQYTCETDSSRRRPWNIPSIDEPYYQRSLWSSELPVPFEFAVMAGMADHTNLDRVLNTLKWYGRYQVTQMGLIYMSVLPGSLTILSYIFVGYDGPHTCSEVTNTSELGLTIRNDSTIRYGECDIFVDTNTSQGIVTERTDCVAGNTYLEHKQVSMVSDWDLVCGKASLSELTQTLFVLGQATGAILCSSLSDRFGRKWTYITNVIGLIITGLVLAFSPNYAVFATFRFIGGICQQGTDLTIATMILEWAPTEKRFKAGTIGSCLWGIALVTLAPLAYLLRNVSWRYLQLAVALTATYSLILPFKLDETLRWLMANGKAKEVERILKKAAKINKVPLEDVMASYNYSEEKVTLDATDKCCQDLVRPVNGLSNGIQKTIVRATVHVPTGINDVQMVDCIENASTAENEAKTLLLNGQNVNNVLQRTKDDENRPGVTHKSTKKYNLLDILRNKMIFKNALIVWYCWVVDSLVYYGLYMTSSALAGNRYLNYFCNSVVEVPAALLIYLTLERFGRKKPSLMFHTTAGVSLLGAVLLTTFVADSQAAQIAATILSMIGKLTITTAFGTLFIYTPELFPTNLRNVGLGAASSVSRLGGMLSPFASKLAKVVAWAPGAIFVIMCLLAGFLIQFLPETRGHELPQTMEEIKEWYRANLPGQKRKDKRPDDI
ncbi:organic cation transporter protein-like [Haliotis asinina]|uniref:organic cation transporter protein-like n=1 Tax=Haliotis asinina TaxID=109174 RepID=UPI0035327847